MPEKPVIRKRWSLVSAVAQPRDDSVTAITSFKSGFKSHSFLAVLNHDCIRVFSPMLY